MIFNAGGRLIKRQLKINGETLESIKSFYYLGFGVVPSGIVTHAMNTQNDKLKKPYTH